MTPGEKIAFRLGAERMRTKIRDACEDRAERTFNDDQAAAETLTLFQEQVIETIEAPEEAG